MDKDSMQVITDFLQKYRKEYLRIEISMVMPTTNVFRIDLIWGESHVSRLLAMEFYGPNRLSAILESMHDEFIRPYFMEAEYAK